MGAPTELQSHQNRAQINRRQQFDWVASAAQETGQQAWLIIGGLSTNKKGLSGIRLNSLLNHESK